MVDVPAAGNTFNALTDRFQEAVGFAIEVHGTQRRKGTGVTLVSHLLGVAALVLEHGGDEDLAIAALLHDAVERAEGGNGTAMAQRIRRAFGDRVADVVLGCSDSIDAPRPPWHERKRNFVAGLHTASDDVVLVSMCDKVYNVRCAIVDLRHLGAAFWTQKSSATYTPSRDDRIWYFEWLLDAYRERLQDDPSRSRLLGALERAIDEFIGLAAPSPESLLLPS